MSAAVPGYHPPPSPGGAPSAGRASPARDLPFASWSSRVGAALIDGLIAAVVFFVCVLPSLVFFLRGLHIHQGETGQWHARIEDPFTFGLGMMIVAMAYGVQCGFVIWNQIYRVSRRGASLGKQALGIVIVRQEFGEYLSFGTAFLRFLMYILLSSACAINYVWPLIDAQKRAWHDMVVGTFVVKR